MISYELAYGIALATVVLMANSMSLQGDRRRAAGLLVRVHSEVVHLPAVDWLLRVCVRGRRRNQPRAVRLPGSRAGAGRRLSHRIQLDALRDVLHGGIHQHGDGLGRRHEPVSRRLARTVHPGRLRLDLVRDQAGVPAVRLPVAALDAAAFPLRPVDVVRMEGAVAAGDGEPASPRPRGCSTLASDALLFYVFAAVTVIGSLVVVSQNNPVYSLLSLVGAFFGLCGLYVLLEAPFLAVVQIIVYAGAIMVLFLFVVMVLNVPREDAAEWDRAHPLYRPMAVRVGGVLAVLLALEFGWALSTHLRLSIGVADERARRVLGRRAGPRPLHRLHVRVRSHVDPDHRGDGRRASCSRARGKTVRPYNHADWPLPGAVGPAVRHRRGRRVPAPQPDHAADVGRDHAERRQPDVRGVRPAVRRQSTARSSRSSS